MQSLIILILGISTLLAGGPFEAEIDYKPKMLLKEISDLTSDKDFHLSEKSGPELAAGTQEIKGKFFDIRCKGNLKYTAYIGRVNCCRAGGCSSQVAIDFNGEFEYFDYFILFDAHNRIITTRVYNYEATHGAEITARGWLKQFIGFDGTKDLRIGKEVDSISGATISVIGLVADIQEKTALLKKLRPADDM